MRHSGFVLVGLLAVFASAPAAAQGYWGVEFRGGADFATQDLADAQLGTGIGLEGTLTYRFMPHLAAYAGWGWQHFSSDNDSFAGAEVDVEETGYTFGLQFVHPLGSAPVGYFVRGGGVYDHLEIENGDGDITADSGHGLGWQVEAGLSVPMGTRWMLMPGVRYRALAREIEIGSVRTDVDLNYITVGVGIARTF